jgi:hypothetical protein
MPLGSLSEDMMMSSASTGKARKEVGLRFCWRRDVGCRMMSGNCSTSGACAARKVRAFEPNE